jgi:protein CpxP
MKTPLKFKLILLLAGAFVLAAPALRADEPAAPPSPPADQPVAPPSADQPERGHGRRGPGAMMERAAKELGLNADQETKWKDIGEQEKTALQAVRNDSSLSKDDKRAKAMETMKTFADQRRAILTEDQQKKFDEMLAKMRERGPRKPKAD